MRAIIVAFAFVIAGILFTELYAQEVDENVRLNTSFKMKGLVTSKGAKVRSGFIDIYKSNELIGQAKIKRSGKFSVHLDANEHYTLDYNMIGHLPKKVVVNTNVENVGYFDEVFKFDVVLYSHSFVKDLDLDFFDYPVAIIQYDKKEEKLAAVDEYSDELQQELKAMYIQKKEEKKAEASGK